MKHWMGRFPTIGVLAVALPSSAAMFTVSYSGSGQYCYWVEDFPYCYAASDSFTATFSLSDSQLTSGGSFDVVPTLNLFEANTLYPLNYVPGVMDGQNTVSATAVVSGGEVADLDVDIDQIDYDDYPAILYELNGSSGTFSESYGTGNVAYEHPYLTTIDGTYTISGEGIATPEPCSIAAVALGLLFISALTGILRQRAG